jgi:hypothetical protein
MAGPANAQDVADALAITLERQDASGAPWCPPGDGAALRRWVTDRSAALGGGIRRVVRLARLMAIADGRDYVQFLYVRLTLLRARQFRSALQAAVTERRLPASMVTFTETGVLLREPALAAQGRDEGFEIDFAQMPRLAALLDFLHNALGFAAVDDLLAPLMQRGAASRSASDIARALHAALNAWLADRLESPNHMRQAQRMRSFLATRGRVSPDAVDDEAILLFWMTAAVATDNDRIDGFRLYTSAASAMLRYRQALRDANAARQLEASLGLGQDTAAAELALEPIVERETGIEPWQSPLRALASLPASRVKWLTRKEQARLLHYLGGPAGEGDAQDQGGEGEPGPWQGGLAGDERFDLRCWLTLLRADVFGAAQASIVGQLRKRKARDAAIEQAMAPIDKEAYTACAADYGGLHTQLRLECLAALASLMEAGAAEAVILLGHLGGRQAVTAVLGSSAAGGLALSGEDDLLADAVRRTIAPALKTAFTNPNAVPAGAGRELLLEARSAARKVSRLGFRTQDQADAGMFAALQSGAAAVVEVLTELDRLMAALTQKSGVGDVAGDRARFLATFLDIYPSARSE